MRQKWSKRVARIGGIILTPLLLMAAPAPTSESNSYGSAHEARRLLKDIQQDARQVEDRAMRLEDYERAPDLDWGPHIHQLNRIRSAVNDMGRQPSRLQAIEGPLAPAEQQAIRDVTPIVQAMADNTTDALEHVKTYQGQFWSAPVKASTHSIESEATELLKTIRADLG